LALSSPPDVPAADRHRRSTTDGADAGLGAREHAYVAGAAFVAPDAAFLARAGGVEQRAHLGVQVELFVGLGQWHQSFDQREQTLDQRHLGIEQHHGLAVQTHQAAGRVVDGDAKRLRPHHDPKLVGDAVELLKQPIRVHFHEDTPFFEPLATGRGGAAVSGALPPANSPLVTGMLRFSLGEVTLELIQGDITQSDTIAIANAANSMLLGGGGVDGAIHRAAGSELADALRELKRDLPGGVLETGGAVLTPGFKLSAKHVIHCVGPIYDREGERAPRLLARCYTSALKLCREHGIDSIAFPSISTGVYGYPVSEAAPVAIGAVRRATSDGKPPTIVRFVLFDDATLEAYRRAAEAVLA
jgi:O-acetyl-ADP-ribose deacetylase